MASSVIEGIDTRRLVRVLRSSGAQQGHHRLLGGFTAALVERARRLPGMEGQDLASKVSCKKPYEWTQGVAGREAAGAHARRGGGRLRK